MSTELCRTITSYVCLVLSCVLFQGYSTHTTSLVTKIRHRMLQSRLWLTVLKALAISVKSDIVCFLEQLHRKDHLTCSIDVMSVAVAIEAAIFVCFNIKQ